MKKQLQEVFKKIDEIGLSGNDEKVLEDIRVHIYKEQLKRLINAIDIFKKIEEKMNENIDNLDIKELINIEKTLVKSIDNIQSLLRQFEPALKQETDIRDVMKEMGISETDNPKQILRKVIATQVVNLLNQVHEAQESLNKYKQGSLGNWKASESLKSLTQVIAELVKTMERLEADTDLGEKGLTVSDIIQIYEEEIAHNE